MFTAEQADVILRGEVADSNTGNRMLAGDFDGDGYDDLIVAAPGLVFAPPTRRWPENVTHPQRWLRTDMPGLVP